MLEYLDKIDKKFLLCINGFHGPLGDAFMIMCTEKLFWIPFYAMLAGYLIWKYKTQSWLVFISLALLITVADQFASAFMKPLVGRLRPCHDPAVSQLLFLAKGCGSTFGFISSHAANSFALACFISLLLKWRAMSIVLFVWAVVVSYSRIYLGAHYPGDVICGALAGILFGYFFYKIYKYAAHRILHYPAEKSSVNE